MVLREQALDTHTPYLLLVQQAALSPQSGDKQKKHCDHILKQQSINLTKLKTTIYLLLI